MEPAEPRAWQDWQVRAEVHCERHFTWFIWTSCTRNGLEFYNFLREPCGIPQKII